MKYDFPLTKFLCRLISMTAEELAEADPRRAAKTYGIRRDWADEMIREEQLLRGVRPACEGPASSRTKGAKNRPVADQKQGRLL